MFDEHMKQGVPKRRFRVRASGTTNTYVYCREAARRALRHAEQKTPGYLYFLMMAGVFAAFTVEAFLNHIGQHRVQGWEALERKLGPREKLLLLRQLLGWSVDESRRPFQTLASMLQLRDALAHGKTVTTTIDKVVKRQPPDDVIVWPEAKWRALCTIPVTTRMLHDAEAICRELSAKCGLAGDPFESPGSGASETSLAE